MSDIPRSVPFTVDGVGEFAFRPRTVGDELLIQRKTREECGCNPDDAGSDLRYLSTVVSELSVLLVGRPNGWVLREAKVPQLLAVYTAFRVAETRFQDGLSGATQAKG